MNCGEIQDLLPDRAGDRLASAQVAEVDEHLATCENCRELFEAVRGLGTTRPAIPDDLEARILAAVRSAVADEAPMAVSPATAPSPSTAPPPAVTTPRSRWPLSPAWGLAAAAVLALAVGLPLVAPSDPELESELGALALAEEGVGQVWLDDDLMVAGAPAVSELSDEALRTLLEEFQR